jgi:hypothetical protein
LIIGLLSSMSGPNVSFAVDNDQGVQWYGRFGYNITQSILNPLEPGGSENATRQEIAAILYDVRMGGGSVVRWIVTDVWPQWRCGRDPEDSKDGEIDAAWFTVTRILLEEAQRQGVQVVVTMTNLADGGFAGSSSDPAAMTSDSQRWTKHRADAAGTDHYDDHICRTSPGYYGHTNQAELFSLPALQQALARRLSKMVDHLSSFPSLAAVELFNEPQFKLTQGDSFWSAVRILRQTIRATGGRSAQVPIFAGVAWWDSAVVGAANRSGELANEPVLTAHTYNDYKGSSEARLREMNRLIGYLSGLNLHKPIVLAEFGSGTSLSMSSQHQVMVDTAYEIYKEGNAAVWVWGNYFPQPNETDYKWDFNHRSPVGDSFRPYFFADHEGDFKSLRKLTAQGANGVPMPLMVTIINESDGTMGQGHRWIISVNGERFIGLSRAGVFPKLRGDLGGKPISSAAETFFLGTKSNSWIVIVATKAGWSMAAYMCDKAGDSETPLELLGLASDAKWQPGTGCPRSAALYRVGL